jgi:hemerythrin superfamily protein
VGDLADHPAARFDRAGTGSSGLTTPRPSPPDARRAPVQSLAGFEEARAVADSVLYEGYLLYPYRTSSTKNRVRWQFGVLLPRPWVEARGETAATVAGSAESWFQQTECLVEASTGASVYLRVRFLQLQHKLLEARAPDGTWTPVEELRVGGSAHVRFDEAVEREADVAVPLDQVVGREHVMRLDVSGGEEVEPLAEEGVTVGRLVRRRYPLAVTVQVTAARVDAPVRLLRLRVRTENTASWDDLAAPRDDALTRSLLAAHTLIGVTGGSFVSLLDPPSWAAAAAADCENLRTFPVLTGEQGTRNLLLSSPIIMYDFPQVSPESPGDLFDATEIDEILSLRTLTLTEQEKLEARATDRRAAAIVDRVEAMPPEVMRRLHGAIRSPRPISGRADRPEGPDAPSWWDPGADAAVSPGTDAVDVGGVRVSRGSRVVLRPRARSADVQDMFLRGRTARVEAVFVDVEDRRHLAVTLEDDPAAELHQWYGRYLYFSPEEVEAAPTEEDRLDAIELLQHDHRMVEQLFRDYRSAASPDQRKGVVDILVRELSKHAAVEEELFYPLANRIVPSGAAEIEQHLRDHHAVKRVLAELDGMSPEDDRIDDLVQTLQGDVARHVEEEEGELMPKVRGHLDEQALRELGEEVERAKQRAPTRPHPAAPDRPPALTLAAPVAAIYDRLRDRIQGRPQT